MTRRTDLSDPSLPFEDLERRIAVLEAAQPQNSMTQRADGVFDALGRIIVRGRLEGEGGALAWNGPTWFGRLLQAAAGLTVNGTARATRVEATSDVAAAGTVSGVVGDFGRVATAGNVSAGGGVSALGEVSAGGAVEGASVHARGRLTSDGQASVASLYVGGDSAFPGAWSVGSLDQVSAWAGFNGNQLVRVPKSVGGPGGGDLLFPFPASRVTDEFGPRPSPGAGGSTNHRGMDFGMPGGTPIPCCGSGTVIEVFAGGGLGNGCVVQHARNIRTLYAHMRSAPYVSVGQSVSNSTILGPVGTTGTSTGDHLHLETHVGGVPVNPRTVITKWR